MLDRVKRSVWALVANSEIPHRNWVRVSCMERETGPLRLCNFPVLFGAAQQRWAWDRGDCPTHRAALKPRDGHIAHAQKGSLRCLRRPKFDSWLSSQPRSVTCKTGWTASANQIHYVSGFCKILSSWHQQLTALNFLCKALWDQLIKNKALQEEDVSVKCSSIPGEFCHFQHEATLFLYTMNTTEPFRSPVRTDLNNFVARFCFVWSDYIGFGRPELFFCFLTFAVQGSGWHFLPSWPSSTSQEHQ